MGEIIIILTLIICITTEQLKGYHVSTSKSFRGYLRQDL